MDLAAFFAQGMLVKQVLGQAILRSSHAAQVGYPVWQLFDGFHLLVQVVCLNEVTQLEERQLNSIRADTHTHPERHSWWFYSDEIINVSVVLQPSVSYSFVKSTGFKRNWILICCIVHLIQMFLYLAKNWKGNVQNLQLIAMISQVQMYNQCVRFKCFSIFKIL